MCLAGLLALTKLTALVHHGPGCEDLNAIGALMFLGPNLVSDYHRYNDSPKSSGEHYFFPKSETKSQEASVYMYRR